LLVEVSAVSVGVTGAGYASRALFLVGTIESADALTPEAATAGGDIALA